MNLFFSPSHHHHIFRFKIIHKQSSLIPSIYILSYSNKNILFYSQLANPIATSKTCLFTTAWN